MQLPELTEERVQQKRFGIADRFKLMVYVPKYLKTWEREGAEKCDPVHVSKITSYRG